MNEERNFSISSIKTDDINSVARRSDISDFPRFTTSPQIPSRRTVRISEPFRPIVW